MTSSFLLFYKISRSREISAAYLVGGMVKASGFIVQLKAETIITTGWKPAATRLYYKKTSHLA
jgi:hypothetical protein